MAKKYIAVNFQNKVVLVCALQECTPLEFYKVQKEAEENFANLINAYTSVYKTLKNKVDTLEKEIKILKGEI